MTITEHDAANFRYGNAYGVARSDVVYIQITVFDTRTVNKKALFRRIELCRQSPGIRPEDVFRTLSTPRELVRSATASRNLLEAVYPLPTGRMSGSSGCVSR
jgi:hypothetical protein